MELRAGRHLGKWNLGMSARAVSILKSQGPEGLSSPPRRRRYEKGRRWWPVVVTAFQSYFRTRQTTHTHTLGRHVTFSSLISAREDDPFPASSGPRIERRSRPDGVTKHGISGQWPPRNPLETPGKVSAIWSPCSVGSGEVRVTTILKHSGTRPSGRPDICILVRWPLPLDRIQFIRPGGGGGASSCVAEQPAVQKRNPLIRLRPAPSSPPSHACLPAFLLIRLHLA